MGHAVNYDIVIIGGGIAGLWTLNHLHKLGHQAILLEKNALGSGQTIASQGIIHGGIKYALTGEISNSSVEISDMPLVWQACLHNQGEIDLSAVKILSEHYYLCSQQKITQRITQFFAQKALHSDSDAVKKSQYPEFFQHKDFSGQLTRVHEKVLDVPSLISALAKNKESFIFKISDCELQNVAGKYLISIKNARQETLLLNANHIILTAGEGNAKLLNNIDKPLMQTRALQMVALHADHLPSIFVHCVELSANPILTITSHLKKDGKTLWYLGGQIAEDGVTKDEATQILAAQTLIQKQFPWFTPMNPRWQTFYLNRAEGFNHGKRPEGITIHTLQNMIIAWPTKLTFAPLLAQKIAALLPTKTSSAFIPEQLLTWPKPNIAEPIWEKPC